MADEPQFLHEKPSNLLSLMAQPLIMTGFLRSILKMHFTADRYRESPTLRKLIWSDSPDTSILIESVHRWTPQSSGRRPAIIVRRNAYSNLRVGLGDRHQGPATDPFGHAHYATFWQGSHTLFCLAGAGANAEHLGTEVQRELTQFGPLIREKLDLKRFVVSEVGPVAQLEESNNTWVVPVTVAYFYDERWVLIPESPKIKSIQLSTILDA